jgi:hypothetical protein
MDAMDDEDTDCPRKEAGASMRAGNKKEDSGAETD